jgi:hypothetical protein
MTSGTGDCTVKYDQAGNDNYDAAVQVTETTHAARASQVITFASLPTNTFGDPSFLVSATGGGSGNPVTFASTTTTVCTTTGTNGSTVAIVAAGTCWITASQAGNTDYFAAADVPQSFTVNRAASTTTASNATATFSTGNQTVALSATVTSAVGTPGDGRVTFTVKDGATVIGTAVQATVSGGNAIANFTLPGNTGAKTYSIVAAYSYGSNFMNSADSAHTLTVNPASQTITFVQPTTPRTFGDVFNVNPTASSALAVSVAAGGGCSAVPAAAGFDVTMTSGTTACVLTASQAGNTNYNAATDVQQTVATQKKAQVIAISQNAPATALYNTTFSVKATGGGSGNAIMFAPVGGSVCAVGTVTSASGTFTAPVTVTSGTGSCQLALNQAANDNYAAAAQLTSATTNAQKVDQTITIIQNAPATAIYNTTFNVKATGGGSGNAITFTPVSSSVCVVGTVTNVSGTFTAPVSMTGGAGTCQLALNEAGNDNYSAAPQMTSAITTAQPANSWPVNGLYYTGASIYWTTSSSTSTATLYLSATVVDPCEPVFNPTPAACTAGVGHVGDIRKAKVSFYTVSSGVETAITGATNLPVGLINSNDIGTGSAAASVQYNLGTKTYETLQIRVKISGAYFDTDPSHTDSVFAVAKPSGEYQLREWNTEASCRPEHGCQLQPDLHQELDRAPVEPAGAGDVHRAQRQKLVGNYRRKEPYLHSQEQLDIDAANQSEAGSEEHDDNQVSGRRDRSDQCDKDDRSDELRSGIATRSDAVLRCLGVHRESERSGVECQRHADLD